LKVNPFILFIVIVLGIYVGLNPDIFKQLSNQIDKNIMVTKTVETEKEISADEKQKRFKEYYINIYKVIHNIEDIDKAYADMDMKNVSNIEAYEMFSKLKNSMEEGQKLPLGRLEPEGFSIEQQAQFSTISDDLYSTFQYRKFSYENAMEHLESGSLKKANESKEWMKSAQSSYQMVLLNLEAMKIELGITEEIEVD
jgi:hypothetical protein